MKTRFSLGSKIIALVLAIVLIPQLLQFDMLARSIVHTVEAAEITEDNSSTEAEITVIGEDESRREENVKHFILSDGARQAVKMRHGKQVADLWEDV